VSAVTLTSRTSELTRRIREVPAPVPVLDRERERSLTDRQRHVLDQLGRLFDGGFADLTMADMASSLNCSLRTLYELAPSREQLVLTVIDRNLWRVGRSAMGVIEDVAPLDAIRTYLEAANVAVAGTTAPFARDMQAVPAAQKLSDDHSDYLVAVTRCLLDMAVESGDIPDVDTGAVARVMASLGRDFALAQVLATLRSSPKEAADAVLGIIMRGLVSSGDDGLVADDDRTGADR
jgi:AcrR family transcriptional regulator|tara:strand:- start:6061 stop:6765 length:705 start_codon:yes stop_codon:yes gene_type:complete